MYSVGKLASWIVSDEATRPVSGSNLTLGYDDKTCGTQKGRPALHLLITDEKSPAEP